MLGFVRVGWGKLTDMRGNRYSQRTVRGGQPEAKIQARFVGQGL